MDFIFEIEAFKTVIVEADSLEEAESKALDENIDNNWVPIQINLVSTQTTEE